MRTPEERREEQRQYESDVYYDVWRAGGDPDRINLDRVEDAYYHGDFPEQAARGELRAQQPRHEPEQEPEWPAMQRP